MPNLSHLISLTLNAFIHMVFKALTLAFRSNIAYEQAGLSTNSIIWIFNNLSYFYQAFDSSTPCQTHRQITLPASVERPNIQ
jgi:hypothetical protein